MPTIKETDNLNFATKGIAKLAENAIKVWEALPQVFKDSLAQSPTLMVVLAVTFYAYRQLSAEHKSHLESKDKEIERLVTEKNALQKEFLKRRLSTDDRSRSTAKGNGASK